MNKLARIITSVLLVIFTGLLYVFSIFGSIENYYEDIAYQHGHAVPSDIKIISIDNKTLEEFGSYSSIKRSVYADTVNYLYSNSSAPSVVGIDVVFSGNSDPEEDRLLKEALEGRNVIIASKLDISTRIISSNHSFEYYISKEEEAYEDLKSVSKSGFTNAILDEDGYLRRAYTVVNSDGVSYDSFAVGILKAVDFDVSNLPAILPISFTGNPGDFETVSMADVLNGTIPASHFADSIVLIGVYEDGMRDSYSVSINHKNPMYGVEIQANTIEAIRKGWILKPMPDVMYMIVLILFMSVFSFLAYRNKLGKTSIFLASFLVLYAFLCFILFQIGNIATPILYVPAGLAFIYLASIMVRYIKAQKQLTEEMKQTLFSMADSMAEAIEGRTPYNANHTKNVAKRCVEMIDYINKLHKQGRTELHFTPNDRDQIYLAAMLHDIGKMDVPLEVMDKPTKLGSHENELRSRLERIRLYIEKDCLTGKISKDDAEKRIVEIDDFIGRLGLFNCGKPLSDEEKEVIQHTGTIQYVKENGEIVPYLTEEELEDLLIHAGTLSDKERIIMQSHVDYTNKILSHVHFGQSFDKVNAMASNHHELLNGKGYPNGIGKEELDVMTRILTIMDIYDSLIADDRPYKKPKSVKVAFEILEQEAEAGKVDKEILEYAKELYMKEE